MTLSDARGLVPRFRRRRFGLSERPKERHERASLKWLSQVGDTSEPFGLAPEINIVTGRDDDDGERGTIGSEDAQEIQPGHALELDVEKQAQWLSRFRGEEILSRLIALDVEAAGPQHASKGDAFVGVVLDNRDA